jgi:uncharacterized protein YoxC
MLLSDATLAHVGTWLLAQLATLPDTIVTKQTPLQPGWFERLGEILRGLMTLSILVLTIAVVPAAWNFRKSYQKISELLDRVYADVNPITHHASRIAENIDYVSTALRADVQRASATLTDASERLQEAIRLAEARARDFDALLAVVQDETEGAFVSTASTVRGMRTGMETLRDTLHLTLRDVRRATLEPLPGAPPRRRRRPDDAADDVANELAAVDVRRTPATGGPSIARATEPAGPATFGALDEIVDDEVEEPLLDDELLQTPTTFATRKHAMSTEATTRKGRTRGASSRASARDEDTMSDEPRDTESEETATLVTAAIIGAAIGAGLGLLASRVMDDDVSVMVRSARKRVGRGVRRGSAAAGALGASAGSAVRGAGETVGDFATRARDTFEDMLQREVRQLRKAARRQRRRLGL